MKLEHQVTMKPGYITNRIYNLGTRDKHEIFHGVARLMSNLRKKPFEMSIFLCKIK